MNPLELFIQLLKANVIFSIFISGIIGGILSLFLNEWYRIALQFRTDKYFEKRRKKNQAIQDSRKLEDYLKNLEIVHAYRQGLVNASLDNTKEMMDFVFFVTFAAAFLLLGVLYIDFGFLGSSNTLMSWVAKIFYVSFPIYLSTRAFSIKTYISLRCRLDRDYLYHRQVLESRGYIFDTNGITRPKKS